MQDPNIAALSETIVDLTNMLISARAQRVATQAALADRDDQIEAHSKRIAELEALIAIAKPAIPPV